MPPIPTIDIAPLASPEDTRFAATAAAMDRACRTIGAFFITNHGVPRPAIDSAYAASRRFHTSPLKNRLRVHKQNSSGTRGWDPSGFDYQDQDPEGYYLTPPTQEELEHDARKNLHSTFDLALEIDQTDVDFTSGSVILVPNQWPDWIPGFRENILEYYCRIATVGDHLFKAFSLALGVPEDFFPSRTTKTPSQLRLLRYTANPPPTVGGNPRIAPHTDLECFTILHQTSPGLQLLTQAGDWLDVTHIDGTYIVTVGDLFEIWTNGVYRAVQHRVVNTGEERYSLPYFAAVDCDTRVAPLPNFISTAAPARYAEVLAGDYFANFCIRGAKHLRKRVLSGDLDVSRAMSKNHPLLEEVIKLRRDIRGKEKEPHLSEPDSATRRI